MKKPGAEAPGFSCTLLIGCILVMPLKSLMVEGNYAYAINRQIFCVKSGKSGICFRWGIFCNDDF